MVLLRQVLSRAGRLLVQRDAAGQVVLHSPLAGMAAVEQRHPSWALGPFGRIEPELPLSDWPALYALVVDGVVRYVGASPCLAHTFDARHGLGEISRRDCQTSGREEQCRLNRLVVAEARSGRSTDLYALGTGSRPGLVRSLTGGRAEAPTALAAEVVASLRPAWNRPV